MSKLRNIPREQAIHDLHAGASSLVKRIIELEDQLAYYEFVAEQMEDALRSVHGDDIAQGILDEADKNY